MKENNPITLVMVCDNHLVVMLAALLKSIENSHFGNEKIDIYIVNDGITKSNVSKINHVVSSERISLFWKTMKEAIPAHIKLPRDDTPYPLCAYARICAPYFLPQNIKKAIYLDIDMVVLKDISNLWSIDLGNYVIAAVQDRFKIVSSSRVGIKNYKELGLHPETKYFNSGLMVINLEKWREMNATQLVIDINERNREYVTSADQYGLNIAFVDNWYPIDSKWNHFAEEVTDSPYLLHFTGVKPIFKGYESSLKYKEIFYSILNLTPWSGYVPKDDYIWKVKKVRSMVNKGSWNALGRNLLIAISGKTLSFFKRFNKQY